ncbi:phosphatase PAP2 family protein [bacterium]|nr:MAG: phosphatase PAP2 family protein [bacterium]
MPKSSLAQTAVRAALLSTVLTVIQYQPAFADSFKELDQFGLHKAHDEASSASGLGNIVFLAAGTLLPLATDGKDGKQHSVRTLDALLSSTAITQGLKFAVHEKRPDGSGNNSFPSGHTSAAFTIATMQSHYHPKQALFWYSGATLIGASRVQLERHYWHDVIAGAAVGYFTAKWELHQGNGLILRPFIDGDTSSSNMSRSAGISLTKSF